MIFLLVPLGLLELYLSLKVGETIGFLWSVVWIVLSMFVGIKLLKASPLNIVGNMHAVREGRLSMQGFQSSATSYLIGSVLLVIPGVLSDFIGIFTLFYALYLQFIAKISPTQKNDFKKEGDNDVIDVEIIE